MPLRETYLYLCIRVFVNWYQRCLRRAIRRRTIFKRIIRFCEEKSVISLI
jgi:hypothetical protein